MATDQAPAGTDLRGPLRAAETETVVRVGVGVALLGSALVHSTVVTEHWEQWPLAGVFFVALQVVETLLALAVALAWSFPTALAVAVSSLGTVAVWGLSRTVGLPFGPPDFTVPESVGAADLACVVLELAAAALVVPWILRRWRRGPFLRARWTGRSVALAAVVSAVAIVVVVLGLMPLPHAAMPGDTGHQGAAAGEPATGHHG